MRTNEEMFKELDEFIESVNCDEKEMIAILNQAPNLSTLYFIDEFL